MTDTGTVRRPKAVCVIDTNSNRPNRFDEGVNKKHKDIAYHHVTCLGTFNFLRSLFFFASIFDTRCRDKNAVGYKGKWPTKMRTHLLFHAVARDCAKLASTLALGLTMAVAGSCSLFM